MARWSQAEWRPLGKDITHQPVMSAHNGIVVHTMVGSLLGTDAYFRQGGYVGTESHMGIGYNDDHDPAAFQWTDTYRTADANLDGNPTLLSIETADMGWPFKTWTGSDVPAWPDDQLELIIACLVWMCTVHHIPAQFMGSSSGNARGIGYHRLGIDSYPTLYEKGWRQEGCQHWSTSRGKVCPGDRRIAQFHSELIPQVQSDMRQQGGEKKPWPAFQTTSQLVTNTQGRLAYAGYYHGGDKQGYYGIHTRQAIRALQQAQGWRGSGADGLIGPQTWALIRAIAVPAHRFPLLEEAATILRPIAAAHPAEMWKPIRDAADDVDGFLKTLGDQK